MKRLLLVVALLFWANLSFAASLAERDVCAKRPKSAQRYDDFAIEVFRKEDIREIERDCRNLDVIYVETLLAPFVCSLNGKVVAAPDGYFCHYRGGVRDRR